ncbi:hypothetical protein [Burkholderia sp. Bp9031]|uniref:hypothetical protein n=1 Tax=Burkholderia sp. Bp9031 TaxID=2184566 RepID=UPI000AC9759B|nr:MULTISPECIES: hypothetical protein [Burkholderia]
MKTQEISSGWRCFTGLGAQDWRITMSGFSKRFCLRLFHFSQHESGLTGRIDFAPFGIEMPSGIGGFFRGFASEL